MLFLGGCLLRLLGGQTVEDLLCKMVQAVAFETEVVAEGVFCEFGLEVNELAHPFRNQSLHFLRLAENTPVHMIQKHVLLPNQNLLFLLLAQMQQLCARGEQLTVQTVEADHQQILISVERNFAAALEQKQNMAVFQDYLLRVQLLAFFMHFSQGHLDSDRWRIVNDQFGVI